MWIAIFLVACFVLWHFLPPAKPPEPSPEYRIDLRARAEDAKWRSVIEEQSESPAETAFVDAMIEAYHLLPRLGSLVGQGLKLDFQVKEGPYRVDFLADGWLVIEIDGAAWHSSPEAQVRDRQRDEFLENLGYTVVRIPAKVVFNNPAEAVRRVRSALAVGKREIETAPRMSGFQRLGQTLSTIQAGVADANRRTTVELAVKEAKNVFSLEKQVVESALAAARRRQENDDWCARDPTRKQYFDEALSDLRRALAEQDDQAVHSKQQEAKTEIPIFRTPSTHWDDEINSAILVRFERLSSERNKYFSAVRNDLSQRPNCRMRVKEFLQEQGWRDVWTGIEVAD